jgi:uncharacterized membrane protein
VSDGEEQDVSATVELPAHTRQWIALLVPSGSAPAWLRITEVEQRGAAALSVVVAIVLQLALPDTLTFGPQWLLPALEALLLVALVGGQRLLGHAVAARLRPLALTLAGTVAAANLTSTGLLVATLVSGQALSAQQLLSTGLLVWVTNVIAFALIYWELDRGGPLSRAMMSDSYPDFLFPQMASPGVAAMDWEPRYFDYVYVSFTNATAFSPTDTMPLSRWAKALMLVQSAVALVTVGLVFARAVNILH